MQTPSERLIILLVGAVQFVNVLDVMIVVPLGPDFAAALSIPNSRLGIVAGSYTAAAAVTGFAASFFVDRFDRRKALAVAMAGLVLGTASCGLATGMGTLVVARALAGAFGGPATSVSFAIIADVVPPERRGRAMGSVMAAFSIASVLGVPLGLELSRRYGFRAPFLSVAGMGVTVTAGAAAWLPRLTGHLFAAGEKARQISFLQLLSRPLVRLSYLLTAVVTIGGFILIPNIAAYVQFNLGYPRARLGFLYLVGGAATFLASRVGGVLLDRTSAAWTGTLGTVLFVCITAMGFVRYWPGLPVTILVLLFMVATTVRNVAFNTLSTRVPRPQERARFLSLQSCIQHLSSAVGSFLSARILSEQPSGALVGIPTIASVSIALAVATPWLFWRMELDLRRDESAGREPSTHA